ncbi:MAG: TolC family protein [Bacteroides sp.]|nr:TolC family protein [Bacteroides sp.]
MKQIIFLFSLCFAVGVNAQQNSIEQVLTQIETNNIDLKANAQLIHSQKLEARTDNNLPDPTVSYAHLWGKENSDETVSELVISQSFDFPTLYASRNKLNKLKMSSFDSQASIARRDILLQAKEVCLDIIMLRQEKEILDERLNNAEQLAEMYATRLETGDANILETNKINLELLNVKTEARLNETNLQNKLKELLALNGNEPITFEGTTYPNHLFPEDFEQLRSEVVASDQQLQTIFKEAAAAHQQTVVNKSQWLPKLELGYRRNTESGDPFNGFVVGFSIPLFENRNKVKMAKAQSLNLNFQKENTTLQVESELSQVYNEAKSLRTSMEEYEKTFQAQSDLKLLKMALTGGQISMIEYFVEVSVVYQSKLNYLQLQNQYQKAMANIYKNRL